MTPTLGKTPRISKHSSVSANIAIALCRTVASLGLMSLEEAGVVFREIPTTDLDVSVECSVS
jgi:hypothetical protein